MIRIGLFYGHGPNHPSTGRLKKRVMPEDVIINCSENVEILPPPGHKWAEVRHDNTATWLCSWKENIFNDTKYIVLNPSAKLKACNLPHLIGHSHIHKRRRRHSSRDNEKKGLKGGIPSRAINSTVRSGSPIFGCRPDPVKAGPLSYLLRKIGGFLSSFGCW